MLFNVAYKDGCYKENDMPDVKTAAALMGYEFCLLSIGMHFFNKYLFDLDIILEPITNIVYGYGMLMCTIMYPINHYFFVKHGRLDRIYREFKHAKINTKRNRIIGYTCLILYWPIMCVIVGHLKYWFP